MISLDLLERKLIKIFSETNQVPLKRRLFQILASKQPSDTWMTMEEKREIIHLLLRRIDNLPKEKRQEVIELIRLYEKEVSKTPYSTSE